VKAHISVILALMAWRRRGYVWPLPARLSKTASSPGGLHDIHARSSHLAPVLRLARRGSSAVELRRQGWCCPFAVGVWPSWRSSSRDLPRAPSAEGDASAEHTRAPVHPAQHTAPGRLRITLEQLPFSAPRCEPGPGRRQPADAHNVRLWTRTPRSACPPPEVQDIPILHFQSLGVDATSCQSPGVVGVRQLNPDSPPTNSWSTPICSTRTHRMRSLSEPDHRQRLPQLSIADVPPVLGWLPNLTQPTVYFA